MSYNTRKKLKGTFFILPAFLIHVIVIVIPALSRIYYAFTKWNGLSEPVFIGLDNFKRMLKDYDFLFAMKNNLIWMAIFLIVPFILGLGLALVFTKIGKVQMIFRTLCFLPYVISATVSGKIFSIFYSPYSGLGSIFEKLGIKALAGFAPLGNEKQALYAAAFVDNWHWWGFVLVLMLSALHQVDTSLYEVAKTEGANAWQTLIHVTIPQIKPTIISYFVFVIIAAFTTFDYVWIMTQGGPAGSTEVFATRIYKTTFINYDAGYGAAMSLSVCILALSVYFVLKFIQKRGRE